jgi:MFS family permease
MQVDHKRWWALAVIALAQFMVIMDTSIIGVALPKMQLDLDFSQTGLSWVFNAYVVAFGGLLLLGGRLSDLFGARRMFTAGWAILLVGSVVAALAASVGVELAGRAVQGVGAALIAPSALTLLFMLFGHEPKELTKAIALYGAAAPAGGTAGVFLGGVISQWLSWPWIFWLYVPIALIALISIPRLMPATKPQRGSVDIAGAVSVSGGLALVVFAVVRAPIQGWGSAQTIGVLAGAIALLVAFVAIQAARRAPLVRLAIFRTPNLAGANLAQLLLGAAWIPMWYFLNLYLQQVLHYHAFASGAALLPMTATIMVLMIVVAPRVIAKLFAEAARTNVSAACRVFGVHRSTYYAWKRQVDRHGLEMLRPRERRRPQMPNQLPKMIEERIVSFSIAHPGLGPKRVASELAIAVNATPPSPPRTTTSVRRSPSPLPSDHQPGSPTKFHDDPDNLLWSEPPDNRTVTMGERIEL